MSATKIFKLTVQKGGFPVVLNIEGVGIDATVTRLDLDQAAAFARGYARIRDPHSVRLVSMRMPGDEQERRVIPDANSEDAQKQLAAIRAVRATIADAGAATQLLDDVIAALTAAVPRLPQKEEFVIDDAEIRRRRLVEMTDEQRARYEALVAEEDAFADAFVRDQLSAHLTIAAGQIGEGPEGEAVDVTSGADFVRIFGARREVLLHALSTLHDENTLPAPLKNALRSLRDSQRSSGARERKAMTTADGERPEGPATNVESTPSATTGTATASSEATSSTESSDRTSSGATAA